MALALALGKASARFYYHGSSRDHPNGSTTQRLVASPERIHSRLPSTSYSQLLDPNHHSLSPRLVILTPTTQEWNDIQNQSHLSNGPTRHSSMLSLNPHLRCSVDEPMGWSEEDEGSERSDVEGDMEQGLEWNPHSKRQGSAPAKLGSNGCGKPSMVSRGSSNEVARLPLTRTVTADHLQPTDTASSAPEGEPTQSTSVFGDEWFPHYRVDDTWRHASHGVLALRSENGGDDEVDNRSGSDRSGSEDGQVEERDGQPVNRPGKPQLVNTDSGWGITQIGNFGFDTVENGRGVQSVGAGTGVELGQLGGEGVRQFGRRLALNQSSDEEEDEAEEMEFRLEEDEPLGTQWLSAPNSEKGRSRRGSSQRMVFSPALSRDPSPPLPRSLSKSPSPRLPSSRHPSRPGSLGGSPNPNLSPPMSSSLSPRRSPTLPTLYTSPPLSPRISRRRQSQKSTRLSAVAGRALPSPFSNSNLNGGLSAFSPFPSIGLNSMNGGGPSPPGYPFPSTYGDRGSTGLRPPPYLRDADRGGSTTSVRFGGAFGDGWMNE